MEAEMNKKELLTTTEVIKQYGISHSTLWHWIKDNKITMYKKKGRTNYFNEDDIKRLTSFREVK